MVCNTSNPEVGGEMVEIFSYPLQVTTSLVVGFGSKCSEQCKYELEVEKKLTTYLGERTEIMNAITQSEIFALISEINAFADNSEDSINNSRSAYEKNKQVLLNRHNSSLSQLEKTYKSNCDAISRKSKKTIQRSSTNVDRY